MERLYLELPTIDRKKNAVEFLQENIDYAYDLNDTSGLKNCLKGLTYEE